MAGAIFFDGVALAQVQTLDITEHSSSLLTAKFNGTDIPAADITGGGDSWTITIPGITDIAPGQSDWVEGTEASGAPIVNLVAASSSSTFDVRSDLPGRGFHLNGETDTTTFFIGNAHLNVTFTDNGDSPTGVPDAATTLSLLSLSLAGLGIFKKKFNS